MEKLRGGGVRDKWRQENGRVRFAARGGQNDAPTNQASLFASRFQAPNVIRLLPCVTPQMNLPPLNRFDARNPPSGSSVLHMPQSGRVVWQDAGRTPTRSVRASGGCQKPPLHFTENLDLLSSGWERYRQVADLAHTQCALKERPGLNSGLGITDYRIDLHEEHPDYRRGSERRRRGASSNAGFPRNPQADSRPIPF